MFADSSGILWMEEEQWRSTAAISRNPTNKHTENTSYFLANSGCPFSSFLHIRHCHFSSVSTRFHYDSPPLPATTSSSPMWSMIQFEHTEWLQ